MYSASSRPCFLGWICTIRDTYPDQHIVTAGWDPDDQTVDRDLPDVWNDITKTQLITGQMRVARRDVGLAQAPTKYCSTRSRSIANHSIQPYDHPTVDNDTAVHTVVALLSWGSHIPQIVPAARLSPVPSSERARRRGWGVASILPRIVTQNAEQRRSTRRAFPGYPRRGVPGNILYMYCLLPGYSSTDNEGGVVQFKTLINFHVRERRYVSDGDTSMHTKYHA